MLPTSNEITCENLTDEITAIYQAQGFTLFFAEELMRYDLTLPSPSTDSQPSTLQYLSWHEQSRHDFFAVYQASFRQRPGFPGWSEEKWLHWTSDDPLFRPDLSFVAGTSEQPLGFVTNSEYEADPAHIGYLIQIGVDPTARGKHLGKTLLLRSLQAWREAGKEAVILHVNHNNLTAMQLFSQVGFVPVGRRGKFRNENR